MTYCSLAKSGYFTVGKLIMAVSVLIIILYNLAVVRRDMLMDISRPRIPIYHDSAGGYMAAFSLIVSFPVVYFVFTRCCSNACNSPMTSQKGRSRTLLIWHKNYSIIKLIISGKEVFCRGFFRILSHI